MNGHTELEITVRGVTEPNASVKVSNLSENPTVVADAEGNFEVTVRLLPGSNVMQLVGQRPDDRAQLGDGAAHDPRRHRRGRQPDGRARGARPGSTAGRHHRSRPRARVAGTAAPNAEVTVTATLVRPPKPNFVVTDGAGQPVAIAASEPGSAGPADAHRGCERRVQRRARAAARARGRLSVATEGGEPITRRVNVGAGDGLRATLRLDGAASYLEVEEDGTPVEGVSGGIAAAGDRVDLSARSDLRIRAGNAGAVRLTINGIGIGAMGGNGDVVEWRITRAEG